MIRGQKFPRDFIRDVLRINGATDGNSELSCENSKDSCRIVRPVK